MSHKGSPASLAGCVVQEACGCRVSLNHQITQCPLHREAERLLALVKEVQLLLFNGVKQEFVARLGAAITAATQEEPK